MREAKAGSLFAVRFASIKYNWPPATSEPLPKPGNTRTFLPPNQSRIHLRYTPRGAVGAVSMASKYCPHSFSGLNVSMSYPALRSAIAAEPMNMLGP
ncbi:MAG: hypothetical protein BWY76_00151 [bacterium ADurb.Bin429]|nr:MAG: hypothetical protein BWY76_00151 [bacterium ADurb.Bin429]